MSAQVLAEIWFGIVAFEIGLYLLLDGADLGIGMLSLGHSREHARSLMMTAIGPIWDANETWLVIAGGTFFGAFPLAYGLILSALYIPVMILIFGIIIRAASFEFHEYSESKNFWSIIFGVGSLIAVIGQGALVGGLLSGIHVENEVFVGGSFDWLSPVTVAITCMVVAGYLVTGKLYLLHRSVDATWRIRSLYLLSLVVFGLGFGVVTLLLMPYIIPGALTIYQAASSPGTLLFMLYGIGPLIPIVAIYNFYLHRVFRAERSSLREDYYG
jgi:cytochrome d ubiquinol oxidase subunit II